MHLEGVRGSRWSSNTGSAPNKVSRAVGFLKDKAKKGTEKRSFIFLCSAPALSSPFYLVPAGPPARAHGTVF